ncbi:MAG TPA: aminopeptidase N [Candidatus Corynebacterium avicola]|uniref:Aminopeptidase N n=1 Tax=Candidatus Corynebacterium avicola TaxID=2838527 RepID=A0A9D1RQK4_9CORY|nr:aminopeptidase N [Candidatus Corynebacterium avicola]
MTSTNLTRSEAAERSKLITDAQYVIDLDLTEGGDLEHRTFSSVTKVTFTATAAGSTFIDLRAEEITSVTLDGEEIRDAAVPTDEEGRYDDTRGLQLTDLSEGRHELTIVAESLYSTTGEGLHRFQDPVDDEVYMYTQFEAADAKRVFPCFDQPDIKATYEVSVRTPDNWTVVTNNTVDTEKVDGATAHHAVVDYPLSTYLIAFCVGPWFHVTDQWTGSLTPTAETADVTDTRLIPEGEITVPLGIFVRQSLAEYLDADVIFDVTKRGFDYYAEHFGVAYPFYKYDQIFCPEYNMGAMENAGCVTIRDEYVFRSAASHYEYERRADTILHELAHMWFGDLVTMEWWDDLWLNESFATWSSAMAQTHATEYETAWVTFANKEKAWAYGQDQLPSTHPVFSGANDLVEVDANFDGITYAKGASLLKQLAAYVGLEPFFAGIRAHFVNHAFDNATFDDLLGALEKASGRDLSDWAAQWLKTTGINTLAADTVITTAADGAEIYSDFAVTQSGAQPGADDTRTHRLAVGLYDLDGDTVNLRRRVELDVEGDSTDVPDLVGERTADLVLVNDDDLTYGFIGLDPESLNTAVEHIAGITDPMARSLIWSATWQMTRNAQMRARDFVALVVRGAHAETQLGVLEQILAQALGAVEIYSDPAWRAEGRAQVLAGFRDGAERTDGQARLAFVRAYANAAQDADSLDWIRGLLDLEGASASAADLLPGFTVDQDLRWRLLTALVGASDGETGAAVVPADEAETLITAEEAADSSSAGKMNAVQARVARPDADTKRSAWDEVTLHGAEMSNLGLRYTMAGITHVGQDALLEPFGPEYVERATTLWGALSSEMALRTLSGLFPSWDGYEELAGSLKSLAEAESTPAGLRRVLNEGISRADRAVAARAFDAS